VLQKSLKIPKRVIRIRISKNTTQWPKEKVQHVKQRFTKHTHKTRDRVALCTRSCTVRPMLYRMSECCMLSSILLSESDHIFRPGSRRKYVIRHGKCFRILPDYDLLGEENVQRDMEDIFAFYRITTTFLLIK
jgi:hypothetical protein